MMKKFFLILFCVALSGCNAFKVFEPDSATLQSRVFLKGGDTPDPYPLYCYTTLGEKMCYHSPRKGDEERLSGYYGPMPYEANSD
jgi:hypothetical protein